MKSIQSILDDFIYEAFENCLIYSENEFEEYMGVEFECLDFDINRWEYVDETHAAEVVTRLDLERTAENLQKEMLEMDLVEPEKETTEQSKVTAQSTPSKHWAQRISNSHCMMLGSGHGGLICPY